MLYVIIIIMKTHSHMVKLILIAVLATKIHSSMACSSNCTAMTPNALCTSQGYCTCKPGFIFNCSTSATLATSNTFLTPLTNARPYYYILASQMGTELEYTLTFTDVNAVDIYSTYQPRIFIDDGMGAPAMNVGGFCNVKPYSLICNLKVTLYNQFDTDLPQNLIMMINMTIPYVIPALSFSYSYTSKTTNTSVFLILGYVAGGLLILTSIILIVVVYRKKGQVNRRFTQSKAEPVVFDISHFQEFMPAGLITVQDKKHQVACSVCLQEFDFNATVRRTICQHVFHTSCLDEWCMKNLSCPMCRTAFNRENLDQMKTERSKRDTQTDWIMNSMVHEEEPSEIRNPLTGNKINDNHAL